MGVGLSRSEQLREGCDVDAEGRSGVELHALARQQEPGHIRFGVPEQVAQLQAKAQALLKQLREGADFVRLAREMGLVKLGTIAVDGSITVDPTARLAVSGW